MSSFVDEEQVVLGEVVDSWHYEDGSIDPAVLAAKETAEAEKPDLWFAERHLRAVRRLVAAREQSARAFRSEIARLTELLAEIESTADKKIEWHERQVEGFHRALEAEGKIGRKLIVPSGVSSLRKAQPEIEFVDEAAFLEYVSSEKAENRLMNAPKPGSVSKAGVKKWLKLTVEDGEPGASSGYVDGDGVPVPGVRAVFRHDNHGIEVAS